MSLAVTSVLAGTTGALTGTVTLDDGTPLAGANVSVSAPTETKSTSTDSKGHFAFISLRPDTYVVTASLDGYDTVAKPGITVFSDNTQTVALQTRRR